MPDIESKGTLEKLQIRAFPDPECNDDTEKKDLRLTVMVNPETFTLSHGVEYVEQITPGDVPSTLTYYRHKPKSFDIELVFDRTGAIPGALPSEKGITADIDKLKKLLEFDGDKHQPVYLKLTWGTFPSACRLSDLQITYKLFKPDGTPLRATARCSFTEFADVKLKESKKNEKSPDVTHVRTVPEDEHLPYLTSKIYGDSKYYLAVAKANGLVNFRKLETGSSLQYPPLEKG
ncbi:MAG: LysM peptidoglycan-binding domain-containing protein [Lewinellaceae bacterium]|nr:hypothetical protein [Saprospiraceae bacterium]MCB9314781.1 LysM peptidoglycan-binding domain-containing protein [Lewinellaceae bacterium]MCB9333129.1 LysM peptidoglycan-binding domain-containing protein [Lewinellaceae bacterium]